MTIQLGAAVDSNLTALAAGQAQFAALDLTGAMIQAGNGKFKDFRAIAAIHQQTLVSIVEPRGRQPWPSPRTWRARRSAPPPAR